MRLDEIIRIPRNPNKTAISVPSQQNLYHGTGMNHLGLIIKSNRLDQGGHWSKPGEPHGVRCTRSLKAAEDFGFEQEFPGGILVLNWPRIAQQYKTIAYVDTMYNDVDRSQPGEIWGDEQEEVILARELTPLSSFLESVVIQKKIHKLLMAGEYLKDEWTDGYSSYDGRPLYVHRRGIQALMDYPNIRVV